MTLSISLSTASTPHAILGAKDIHHDPFTEAYKCEIW